MMYQWLLLTLTVLVALVVGAIVGIIGDRWIRESEQLDARSKAAQAPRHAKTEPRRQPERTSLVQDPDRITWVRDETVGGPVEIPGKRHAEWIDRKANHTPRHVILPEPGEYPPQPVRSTAPGTVTMPRVELVDASTGELRAVTDRFIAEHCT